MYLCTLRRREDFLCGGADTAVPDVVLNRVIKQRCILRYDANTPPERLYRHVSDVLSINEDASSLHIIKTEQQSQNR